jgi:hypothetical protein
MQSAELIPLDSLSIHGSHRLPSLFAVSSKAEERFYDFFGGTIRNENTRLAYYKAALRFSAWCGQHGLSLLEVQVRRGQFA